MAFQPGKNTVFKVDNAAGTLTDISAYLKRSGLPRTADAYDTTTYGKSSKVYIPGLLDGRIPIEGPWDPTVDAVLAGILGVDDKDFELGPEGSTTPDVKYTGKCLLIRYDINPPVDGAVTFSGEFQLSDDVTRGTY